MLIFYKQKGETPLQTLDRLRLERVELKSERLSYAGRLDPMAEGLLLILVGDENNDREKYLGLPKTYQTNILFGVQTDTGDLLGMVNKVQSFSEQIFGEGNSKLLEILNVFKGEILQNYPDFSSKTVNGKPLFQYARDGLDIPKIEHKVSVFEIKILDINKISAKDLLSKVQNDVSRVFGDFRQKDILDSFEKNLNQKDYNFIVLSLELSVSSGFYVRQFAMDLGVKLKTPALALDIKRIKIGGFGLKGLSS
jgi:tRNA pseudouridine55 synthase